MRRQLNYTGKKKVTRKEAIFSFADDSDPIPEFNVLWSLDEESYPENAAIYVEAHYKETRQRFCYGTIGSIMPPANRCLDQLDLTGTTLFDVLIVDETGRHGPVPVIDVGKPFGTVACRINDQDRPCRRVDVRFSLLITLV